MERCCESRGFQSPAPEVVASVLPLDGIQPLGKAKSFLCPDHLLEIRMEQLPHDKLPKGEVNR
jgi:hypothetical protein